MLIWSINYIIQGKDATHPHWPKLTVLRVAPNHVRTEFWYPIWRQASQPSFPLDLPQNLFAVILSSLLATFLY
jgi:hypothetical protein